MSTMTKNQLSDELGNVLDTMKELLYYLDEMKVNLHFYDSEGKPTPYKECWDRVAMRVLYEDIKNVEQKDVIKKRIDLKEQDFDKYFYSIGEFDDYWKTLNS